MVAIINAHIRELTDLPILGHFIRVNTGTRIYKIPVGQIHRDRCNTFGWKHMHDTY
jgi:hypothetical protein